MTLQMRTIFWSTLVAITAVLVYCVVRGYHQNVDLMVTVAIVRLAAAYAVGAGIAVVVTLGFLIAKRAQLVSRFVVTAALSGSTIVVLLAVFNLLSGNWGI